MKDGWVGTTLRMLTDHRRPGSAASHYRSKRFAAFSALIQSLPRPVHVLDIGGEEDFWHAGSERCLEYVKVTLLNLLTHPVKDSRFRKVAADARCLPFASSRGFDVVFSNSVIEHMGTKEEQRAAALEIRRIGKKYFVQTPSKWFPLEPHFLFPFFQFLPVSWRAWIACHYRGGWYCRPGNPAAARKEVESIRLLTRRECRELFPGAEVRTERLFGMTKSYMIVGGWDAVAGTSLHPSRSSGSSWFQ